MTPQVEDAADNGANRAPKVMARFSQANEFTFDSVLLGREFQGNVSGTSQGGISSSGQVQFTTTREQMNILETERGGAV